jgi:hypothetical protein
MSDAMKTVIDAINELDAPENRKHPLPDDATILIYEKKTGFTFPPDYKIFLKNVSNAFVGYISPFTLSKDFTDDYGDLHIGMIEGRKVGVPHDWLPICEDNGDYYCITPAGEIHFWDHNGTSQETWPDLPTWIKEVWLEGS